MCVCVCALTSASPQLAFPAHLPRFMSTVFFSYNSLSLLFWNPRGAADRGSEGEAGSSTRNSWLRLGPQQAKERVTKKKKNPLILAFLSTGSSHELHLLLISTHLHWPTQGSIGPAWQGQGDRVERWNQTEPAVDDWKSLKVFIMEHYDGGNAKGGY